MAADHIYGALNPSGKGKAWKQTRPSGPSLGVNPSGHKPQVKVELPYKLCIENPLPNPVRVILVHNPSGWKEAFYVPAGDKISIGAPDSDMQDYKVDVMIFSRFDTTQALGDGGIEEETVINTETPAEPIKKPVKVLSLADMMAEFDKEGQKA